MQERVGFLVDALRHPDKGTKLLGAYLIFLGAAQIGLLGWPGGPPFVLDPHAGISFLLLSKFLTQDGEFYLFWFLSGAWLLSLGILMVWGRALLKTYIVIECLLSTPTLLLFALFLSAGGSFHMPLSAMLLYFLVFIPYSAIPVTLAIRILWQKKRQSAPGAS